MATQTRTSSSGPGRYASPAGSYGGKRRGRPLRAVLTALICAAAALELIYFLFVYSTIPFITKWRTIYIETAMSTMTHQWLATSFIPGHIIDDVMQQRYILEQTQDEITSSWNNVQYAPIAQIPTAPASGDAQGSAAQAEQDALDGAVSPEPVSAPGEEEFYELFYELDRDSLEAYLADNPHLLDHGWEKLKFNESGLDDDGTEVYTVQGEQVLALDAENNILIVRQRGTGYKGVLAIVKDPSQLSVAHSGSLGSYGQFAWQLAEANGALIAMNASGFEDTDGVGTGGLVAGLSISDGVRAGEKALASYKRLELRDDDRMYIVNSYDSVASDTRDAMEFLPALIIDGEKLVDGSAGWGIQPRAAIGQSDRLEILMLVIEGRQGADNIGITLGECADILLAHGAVQALNLDGGSSAIMVYEGESITMCSNKYVDGRTLPNAFIVKPAQ